MRFRGASDRAPAMAEGEQQVTVGIAVASFKLRFQGPPKSKMPILPSTIQMDELNTALYTKDRKAECRVIKKYQVPLNKGAKGHLSI
eukprot:6825321-Pyramimonas_sp.AAC.1